MQEKTFCMVNQPKVRQHDIISTAGWLCIVFCGTVLHYEVSSVVVTLWRLVRKKDGGARTTTVILGTV